MMWYEQVVNEIGSLLSWNEQQKLLVPFLLSKAQ